MSRDFVDGPLALPDERRNVVPMRSAAPLPQLPEPIDWTEFWKRDHTDEEWLVPNLLPLHRSIAIYAGRKVGKSLLMLEVAVALATGRPVFGAEARDPMSVVYFDYEMSQDDLHERLEDLGYGSDVDLSRFAYYLLPTLAPLDTEVGGRQIMAIVERHEAEVVVIDTMGRAVTGGEDHADTYRAYWRATGQPLKAFGATVVRLDHQGKDAAQGMRGSSSKGDDVDVVWRLAAGDKNTLTLTADVSRMPWVPKKIQMQRLTGPLRHEIAAHTWPAGTAEVAAELDRLNVPIDASARVAAAAIRSADPGDKGRRKEVVDAAVRYRRLQTGAQP